MLHAGEILEGIVEKLSQASRELSGQIRTSSKNCYHQQERIAESSVATRQMNQATQDVAASCSRAANDTDTAMEAGNKGAAVINETMASIFAITPQTAQLKTGLQELNEEVRNIGQIMTVINDIADQTNLLALNAAIEAARAGNAGRGFAVVADEVRKLAEKTMGATKDVGTAINAIQQSTRASVSRMEKAEEAVEKGRDNAEQAGAALEKIVALIGETSRQTQSIASAVEEQSASTEHIMEAMEEISGGAETTASAMQCSEEHLEVLVNMISELEVMLKGFRTQSDEFADNRLPGSGQLALDAA
jgi:methyl-accepting chemotaxis protein